MYILFFFFFLLQIRDTAVMLWRYGYSLLRLNWAVDDLLERFDRIYELQDQGQ